MKLCLQKCPIINFDLYPKTKMEFMMDYYCRYDFILHTYFEKKEGLDEMWFAATVT